MGLLNNGGWAYHHRLGVDTTAPGVDSAAPHLASASGAAAAEGLGCFGDGSPPSVAATQLRMGILRTIHGNSYHTCGDLSINNIGIQ